MKSAVDYEINKELGECYLFMGEFDKAYEYYTKAVVADPDQAEPFLGLAAVALNQGSFDDAYTYYIKGNSLSESDKSLTGMAMLEVEQGEHEKALTHYLRALELNPLNMVAMNGLVQLCYFLKRLDLALPHLEASLALKSDETVRFTLAGCLLNLGKEEEARKQLEVLLGENPGNLEAQELYAHVAA